MERKRGQFGTIACWSSSAVEPTRCVEGSLVQGAGCTVDVDGEDTEGEDREGLLVVAAPDAAAADLARSRRTLRLWRRT